MPLVIPTHQGRAAEKIIFTILGGKGKYCISNTLFDTTRANIECSGAEGIDLICEEGKHPTIPAPFKGNMDVEALKSGKWIMICNDTIIGRHLLSAYLSDDEGATWKWSRPIEEAPFDEGSFSYPTVIQTTDGLVHVTYSFKRKGIEGSSIKHAYFDEEWVLGTE